MNYQKIYNHIIERAQNRKLKDYKEKHHIIPKCIGGLNKKENLVELTAREHFLCHRLLVEIYPKETKLWYALWLMTIGKQKNKLNVYKVNSRDYERLKQGFISNIKGKIKPGTSLFQKGKKKTYTTGPKKGSKKHDGFGQLISKAKKGKKRVNFVVTEKMLAYRKKPRNTNPRKVVKLEPITLKILERYDSLKKAEIENKGVKNAIRIHLKLYKNGYWAYLDKNGNTINY
jgi:hypothetical protein